MSIIGSLLVPLLVIGAIVYFIRHKKGASGNTANRQFSAFLSIEDAVSELFLLLAFCFLGVTLLSFNKEFDLFMPWQAILLITSAIGLAGAYFFRTVYVLAFSVIGLAGWWGYQASLWAEKADIKAIAIMAGLFFIALFLYTLGRSHEFLPRLKRFSLVYVILGVVSVTGCLFVLSTQIGIKFLNEMTGGLSVFSSWSIVLSLFTFLVALIISALYAASKKAISVYEIIALLALAILMSFSVLTLKPTLIAGLNRYSMTGVANLTSAGILWAIIFNIAIFAELIGLIFVGYLRKETWLINLGAIILFLLIIVKYFDWFFSFMNKGIFFTGAGLLLLILGWLMEKSRRYVISEIQTQQ